MGKPAARLTDMHTCPMVTGLVPHVGGPVTAPGVPTVLVGFLPAAVVGDMCVCVGPPDAIAMGSPTVFIGGKMAARMGDPTVHGGVIVVGCPTVLIGEVGSGGAGGAGGGGGPPAAGASLDEAEDAADTVVAAQVETLKQAANRGAPFCEICQKAAGK